MKTMYICMLDAAGPVLVHRNVKSTPEAFLRGRGPVPGQSGRGGGVHVHVVMARGSVRPPKASPSCWATRWR